MRYAAMGIGVFVLLVALGWFALANQQAQMKVFAPREEQIRRETFEQSKAYSQGTIQQLDRARLDYAKSKDPEERAALRSIVLHETADFDLDRLPPDDAAFVLKLRQEEAGR